MANLPRRIIAWLLLVLGPGLVHGQVLVRSIPAPSPSASSLCWDGSAFWVGDNSALLIKVSLEDGAQLDTVTAPVNGSDGLAWDGTGLWTISGVLSRPRIYRLDPQTGSILDSIPDPAAGFAGGMTWDGQHLWVSRYSPSNALLETDTANGTILTTLPAVGDRVYGLAFENGYLWNSSQDDDGDFVYRIDASSGEVVWQFQLPPHASLPNRRIRGLSWVNGFLWIVAYAQNSTENRILQYDVSNAIYPDIAVSDTGHDFGAHVVGFPAQWTLTCSNIGNVVLSVDSITFSRGVAYHLVAPGAFPVQVPSQGNIPVVVQFAPLQAGLFRDTLRIYSNDPDENPLPILLAGTGLLNEGDIDPVPEALDFGEVWIPWPGMSSARTVEIHNRGWGVLTVSGVQIPDEEFFRLDAVPLPMVIDSQSYANLRVWFDPRAEGPFTGDLMVSSNDPDEPLLDILLSGRARAASFDSGTVIWQFRDFSEDWDIGINAIHWVADVNGDGVADVVASSGSGLTFCLNGSSSGTADTLWTFDTRSDPNHSGAVYGERALSNSADLTGDGIEDIILGTSGGSRSVYALSGETGEQLWMFDTDWWGNGGWVYDVEPIADVNGDFVDDVVAAAGDDGSGTGPRRVFSLSGQDGSLIWEGPVISTFYTATVIHDANGDSIPDVVGGTTGWVVGINGASGGELWRTNIGSNSPVFDAEAMGNANPDENESEDIVVASSYLGVYSIDGATGEQLWLYPISGSTVYQVTAGSDITGDGVREVYAGTVSGHVLCLDGFSGQLIWDEVADPVSPSNVLSLTTVPDLTRDLIDDLVCGTLGEHLVVLEGWDGRQFFATQGEGVIAPVDAVSILPDIDRNGSWEVLFGNREGMIECVAGGGHVSAVPRRGQVPTTLSLAPAFPNPFNATTTVRYTIPSSGQVRLTIYNIMGQKVATLVDGVQQAGYHTVSWNAANRASGAYIYQLQTGGHTMTQKMVLLK